MSYVILVTKNWWTQQQDGPCYQFYMQVIHVMFQNLDEELVNTAWFLWPYPPPTLAPSMCSGYSPGLGRCLFFMIRFFCSSSVSSSIYIYIYISIPFGCALVTVRVQPSRWGGFLELLGWVAEEDWIVGGLKELSPGVNEKSMVGVML